MQIINRLITVIVIMVILLVVSNIAWLIAWCQYDYVSEEVTVDSGNGQMVYNHDGDLSDVDLSQNPKDVSNNEDEFDDTE